MSLLFAVHYIAAQLGDGLRPELIRLLQQPKSSSKVVRAAAASADCAHNRTAPSKTDPTPAAE
jgi:hypothetical protein